MDRTAMMVLKHLRRWAILGVVVSLTNTHAEPQFSAGGHTEFVQIAQGAVELDLGHRAGRCGQRLGGPPSRCARLLYGSASETKC